MISNMDVRRIIRTVARAEKSETRIVFALIDAIKVSGDEATELV